MLTYFILALAVLSVSLDWLLFRRLARKYPARRALRRTYLTASIAIDAVIVVALSLYHRTSEAESEQYMRLIMWVIWLFFASIVPKIVYAALAWIDYPVSRLRKRPSRIFSRIGLAAAALTLLVLIWGATFGRTHIDVHRIALRSDKLPAAFDGYRIALFTDLHTGTQPRNRRLIRRMVALINREHPDMVVNAGDLVNIDSHELDDRVMSILSTLHGRDGVYSVLGNHDLGFYMRPKENFTPRQSVEELLAKQRAMGWKPLVNESAPIRRGADSILVTGVNFPETGTNHGRDTGMAGCDMQEVFRNVPPDTYNLLLAHTPEQWDEARSAGAPDLTLSGHVHAMQFKLTLGPWSWSPAKFLYERWSGLYSENGKHLYINDGMGYVMYPMRIGTNPSITVITLESEKRR